MTREVFYRASVRSFAKDDGKAKYEQAQRLVHSISALLEQLSRPDTPNWLTTLEEAARKVTYRNSEDAAEHLLRTLMARYSEVEELHDLGGAVPLFDFDELYERHRDAGKLPELFDELIEIVQQMIKTGEIDSRTALEGLEQILALLRANRDGSFLAVKTTFSAARFLKHLLDESLKNIPGLRELRAAYDRTIDEGEQRLRAAESAMKDEVLEAIRDQLPKLQQIADYQKQSLVFLERIDGEVCANPAEVTTILIDNVRQLTDGNGSTN